MVRDQLKSAQYFNEYIENLEQRIQQITDKLNAGEVPEQAFTNVITILTDFHNALLKAGYSLGDDMSLDKWKVIYKNWIHLVIDNWVPNRLLTNEELSMYGTYGISQYLRYIELFSWGILLNSVDKERYELYENIKKDQLNDILLSYLSYSLEDWNQNLKNSNTFFAPIKELCLIDEPYEFQNKAEGILKNPWDTLLEKQGYFQGHNSKHDTYPGYWCVMVSAIQKLKGYEFEIDSPYYVSLKDFE